MRVYLNFVVRQTSNCYESVRFDIFYLDSLRYSLVYVNYLHFRNVIILFTVVLIYWFLVLTCATKLQQPFTMITHLSYRTLKKIYRHSGTPGP